MMRRTALFLVLSFLIFGFNVKAEDVYSLWIQEAEGLPGEIVNCRMMATNLDNITSVSVEIRFNTDELVFEGVDFSTSRCSDLNCEKMFLSGDPEGGVINATLDSDRTFPVTWWMLPGNSWEVAVFKFRIRSLVEPGVCDLDLSGRNYIINYIPGRGTDSIPFKVENGAVNVLPPASPRPPDLLSCVQDFRSVVISWENCLDFESFEIMKNGRLLASLPAGSTGYVDQNPSQGNMNYTVRAKYEGLYALPVSDSLLVREPRVNPVKDLTYTVLSESKRVLQWINKDSYSSIRILQGNEIIAELDPDQEEYVAEGILNGAVLYSVIGVREGVLSKSSNCVINGNYVYRLGSVAANPGDQNVLVPLYISNPGSLSSATVNLEFDDTKIEVSDFTVRGALLEQTGYFAIHSRTQSNHYGIGMIFKDYGAEIQANFQPYVDVCVLYFIVNISESVSEGEVLQIGVADNIGEPPMDSCAWAPDSLTNYPFEQIAGEVLVGNEIVKGVQDLCVVSDNAKGTNVILTWKNSQEYDEIIIERNGKIIASVDGTAEQYKDELLDTGSIYWYKVRGKFNDEVSLSSQAPFTNLNEVEIFRRGDVNGDNNINISDPINILSYMFQDLEIGCLDSADANDDGSVNIADPIYLLYYLFGGNYEIPAPGVRVSWIDPTADKLSCEEPMH